MSDLKSYLASKYMSGPKADAILARAGVEKKKKRKRKNEDYVGGSGDGGSSSGLVLQDEDERWSAAPKDRDDGEGDDAPVIGKEAATFKRGKSAWATVGASALPLPPRVKDEDETAPAPEDAAPKPQLTKRRGGLRTAKQMAEEAEAAAAAAAAAAARLPSPGAAGGAPDHTKTVYRDQSGRVVDIESHKEQARRDALEEQRKAEERKTWTKGLVQREDARKRRAEEARMATTDVARHADDVRMNDELKKVERWDDPAMTFAGTKRKKKGPRFPTYQGAWPENRFGIAPGYRWDGVDRSNGFEKKWLQAQNTAARVTVAANKWSMEDM